MSSTFMGLNVAKTGIFAYKTAMEVTANNISNVNTEGYTRQRTVLSSIDPYKLNNLHINTTNNRVGNGVEVSQIEATRDEFTNSKIVDETSDYHYKDSASTLLAEVESIINQTGSVTLSCQMDAYWQAWEDLSNDPSNTSLRQNLVAETETLIGLFQEVDEELRELQGTSSKLTNGSIENQIQTAVDEINSIATSIGDLNRQIARAEVTGVNANELRDKRQVLVEELSEYINIDTFYSTVDGSLTINCGSHQLVQHTKVNQLYVTDTKYDGLPTVSFNSGYPEYSNNPDIASAIMTTSNKQYTGTITISQLAQAEEQYSFLTYHPLTGALSNFGVSSGTFTMNGREFELDADNTSLQDLADMINGANIEVDAKINESGQLILNSRKTGEDYKITSADGTSNIITVLNLSVSKEAKNAIFNYNHIEYVTQSNEISDALDGVTLYLKNTGVADLDMRPIVKEGKLRALMEVRDGAIQGTLDKLNDLAYAIMVETNDVHRSGFTLKGETGINFFEPVDYSQVKYPYKDIIQQMSVSNAVLSNLCNIAAAGGEYVNETDRLKTSIGVGDGSNAIKIAQLKQGKFFNSGRTTFDGFYNQIVTEVATSSSTFTSEADYSNDLLTQLKTVRSETAGVSLDEELANLIQYQHAYNACARVMTAIDEMIDKVVNGMI